MAVIKTNGLIIKGKQIEAKIDADEYFNISSISGFARNSDEIANLLIQIGDAIDVLKTTKDYLYNLGEQRCHD